MTLGTRFLSVAPLAALLICPLVRADINGFGNFSQFTVNQVDGAAAPTVSPGSIHLTNPSPNEIRSIFFNTPQPISTFSASFTYQALNQRGGFGEGVAFVLQNSAGGAHALGQGAVGEQGISPSAAITLELQNPIATSNASGFYTNGNHSGGAPPVNPVNLASGDPVNTTLTYDGSILQETLLDMTSSATYTTSFLANLPPIVGGPTAYVGFTAGTDFDGLGGVDQIVSNFQFTPEPGSLALMAVAAGLVVRRRR